MINTAKVAAYRAIVNALLALGENATVKVVKSHWLPKGEVKIHKTHEIWSHTPSVILFPAKFKDYEDSSDSDIWLHLYATESIFDEYFDESFTDCFDMPVVKDGKVTLNGLDYGGDIDTLTLELDVKL